MKADHPFEATNPLAVGFGCFFAAYTPVLEPKVSSGYVHGVGSEGFDNTRSSGQQIDAVACFHGKQSWEQA
jgi:hypothetical protein